MKTSLLWSVGKTAFSFLYIYIWGGGRLHTTCGAHTNGGGMYVPHIYIYDDICVEIRGNFRKSILSPPYDVGGGFSPLYLKLGETSCLEDCSVFLDRKG